VLEVFYFGFNFPFYDRTFVLPTQINEKLIKNDILQLLLTRPGTRVKRPDFGTDIPASPFEPLDDQTVNDIRNSVRIAIEIFEPRVTLKDVIVGTTPENYLATVTVLAALKLDPTVVLTVEARLAPDLAVSRPAQQAGVING